MARIFKVTSKQWIGYAHLRISQKRKFNAFFAGFLPERVNRFHCYVFNSERDSNKWPTGTVKDQNCQNLFTRVLLVIIDISPTAARQLCESNFEFLKKCFISPQFILQHVLYVTFCITKTINFTINN